MRLSLLLLPAVVSASWFGNDDSYTYKSWSTKELKDWLHAHNIPLPADSKPSHDTLADLVGKNWNSASTWTQDQYTDAQKTFSSIRQDSFDAWDESALRSWLVEQGVIAPKNKKEELILLAKQRYKSYLDASEKWSNWAADSAASSASSATSYAAAATHEVSRALDDTKDYVYSTWDDNRLRGYLEGKGVLKTKQEKRRDELLAMMRDTYAKAADPAWDAWSTSYMHSWLVDHGIIEPQLSYAESARKTLTDKMSKYYYDTNSFVWDSWSDSDIRAWLVDNGFIKDDSRALKRDKMLRLLENSYTSATTTILSTWSESQLRSWLADNGFMTPAESAKLSGLNLYQRVKDQFTSTKQSMPKSVAPYHYSFAAWPDPRLRAFLVEHGVKESSIPDTRPTLLQKVGEVWSQTAATWTPTNSYQRAKGDSEALFVKIQNIVNSGVEQAEDKVSSLWDLLMGHYDSAAEKGAEATDAAKEKGSDATESIYSKTAKITPEVKGAWGEL